MMLLLHIPSWIAEPVDMSVQYQTLKQASTHIIYFSHCGGTALLLIGNNAVSTVPSYSIVPQIQIISIVFIQFSNFLILLTVKRD